MLQRFRPLGLIAFSLLLSVGAELSCAEAQDKAEVPPGFVSATAKVNGTTIHYVRGGKGPPIILIHGFPEDWFEYRAIMPRLSRRFTVVAVDLRGIGGSAAAAGGYDAANMAADVRQVAEALKLERAYVVGHDLGGIVTYAYLRKYPQTLRGAMILDVPLPGIAGWDDAMSGPGIWHVGFMQVPGLAEKLVLGRQAAFLGYFYDFGKFTPAERAHYLRAYASPAQLHAAFEIYRAFPADVGFNAAQTTPIDVPLVVAAGEKSPFVGLVPKLVEGLRAKGLSHVETATIPGAVHYLVADQPEAVATLIEQHASK
jgi:pimeloyl-ACP methyl ester carboxylesterase